MERWEDLWRVIVEVCLTRFFGGAVSSKLTERRLQKIIGHRRVQFKLLQATSAFKHASTLWYWSRKASIICSGFMGGSCPARRVSQNAFVPPYFVKRVSEGCHQLDDSQLSINHVSLWARTHSRAQLASSSDSQWLLRACEGCATFWSIGSAGAWLGKLWETHAD